jgi:hypothetical protein
VNLSYAIAGLKAHEAAGSMIKYVELGNEMYDSSRGDVMAAYPNGTVYAEKMAAWTLAIKSAFPAAQVALIGCRWNAYRKEREDNWNKQVLQNPVSASADAATFHIYCPWDENDNSTDPTNLGKHLAQAYFRAQQNAEHVQKTVPGKLRLWVTEMGVYPTGPLLWTWLEALFYAMLDLTLPTIQQLDIITPYCLVCGDPTAPSFVSGLENADVPPAQAGEVPWELSLKGHAQSLIFKAAKLALPAHYSSHGSDGQPQAPPMMTPLRFDNNPTLDSSVEGSHALLGWRFGSATLVIINAGAATSDLDLGSAGCKSYTGSFPKGAADVTAAGLLVSQLGVLKGSCSGGGNFISLPGYSIVSVTL